MVVSAPMTPRVKLLREIFLILGGEIIDVELTPEHMDLAFELALERYRQRSANSVSERFSFLELLPDQTEYRLPDEVIEVRNLYRRGTTGTASGTGVNFDPFGAAFVNQVSVGLGSGAGSLLTYELFTGFQELVGRMFGLFINYKWHQATHTLFIERHIRGKETILMQIYVKKSEDELLADINAKPWLRDYTTARCKIMLAEARGKFASMVGPQGGTTLNADALKAEGQAELDRLEKEVSEQFDQEMGYSFVIG